MMNHPAIGRRQVGLPVPLVEAAMVVEEEEAGTTTARRGTAEAVAGVAIGMPVNGAAGDEAAVAVMRRERRVAGLQSPRAAVGTTLTTPAAVATGVLTSRTCTTSLNIITGEVEA